MNNKRLKILSQSEINELYGIPQFNSNEQETYFDLTKKEYKVMVGRGSLASSKVHFILQLGYFKATSQFFDCTFDEVNSDVNLILKRYFDKEKLYVNSISQKTIQANQTLIADLLGFQVGKSIVKEKLAKMLEIKVKLSGNPVYLFHEVLCYSTQHKLMLPSYSTIQDLIGSIITREEETLGELLKKHLSHDDWKCLTSSLTKEENEYILSALKKDPKSFKQKHIKVEIKKLVAHETLYKIANRVLPEINITNQNIHYYAILAEHYPISDLRKLSPTKQAIYVLCYAHHRHQKINDNLIMTSIHYLEKFKSEASTNAREKIFDEKLQINDNTKHAAIIFRLFDDDNISDKESFGSIRKRARKYVKKGQFNIIADYLMGLLFDFHEIKWNEIAKLKKKVTTNIRPIFKNIEFSGEKSQQPLLNAITFLKNYFSSATVDRKNLIHNVPIKCIPYHWRQHLIKDSIVDMAKFEFMIYQLIAEQIETGHVYVQNSISFKSLSSSGSR